MRFYSAGIVSSLKAHRSLSRSAWVVACSIVLIASIYTDAAHAKKKKEPAHPVVSAQDAWIRAQDLFDRERYFRSREILKDITLNYSGSTFIDSVQFLLARTSFEMEDFLVAADEFRRVVSQYTFSQLVGDAAFWEARCYYEQAPGYQLDQEYTARSLDGFQRFLEDYPGHALSDSAYKYLGLCREKLARKDYMAAELYFRLEEFASAILYSDAILSDYYDTSFARPAQLLRARSYVRLKDWERAREALNTYLGSNPTGAHGRQARRMLQSVEGKLAAAGSTSTVNP